MVEMYTFAYRNSINNLIKTIKTMKKKLNFLCVLMLLLMAAQVVVTFVTGADAFAEGWREGASGKGPNTWGSFLEMIGVFLVVIAAIVSFACFVRFILNVNRNEVFVWDNVPLLRLTGIGLFIVALFAMVDGYFNGREFAEVFDASIDILIFSVFNLIVSEVFAIGLKLKNESDLTI
jgi:hypothetical protein